MQVACEVALKIKSPNLHETPMAHAGRKRKERNKIAVPFANALMGKRISLPFQMRLIRYGRKEFDKHDNLRLAFKHVVDQVCAQLGVDDKDPQIKWVYEQRPGSYRVRVEVEEI